MILRWRGRGHCLFAFLGHAHVTGSSGLSSLTPRATILSVPSGSGLCSIKASSDGPVIQVSTSSGVVRITGIAFGWMAPTSAFGSVVRNAKMSLVVSPSLTLRTDVQLVQMPAKQARGRVSSNANQMSPHRLYCLPGRRSRRPPMRSETPVRNDRDRVLDQEERALDVDVELAVVEVIAVVTSMTLNLLALASTVSMLADGLKARGTVFQNTQGGRPTAVQGPLITFRFGFLG